MNSVQRFSLRIVIAVLLFWSFLPESSAQRAKVRNLPAYDLAPYHFGFILGMNQMLFSIKTTPGFQDVEYSSLQTPDLSTETAQLIGIEHNPALGFTIGIVSNLRLTEQFDLRFVPSLSFGERDIIYSIRPGSESNVGTEDEGESRDFIINKKLQSTFIEFPLHLKFKGSRMNNIRPYWLVGAKYVIDLASDSKKKKEESNNVYVAINRNDVYGEMGAGLDFYTTFFKFGVEVKMAYGITDILKRENNIYTGAIDKMNSKLFLLSFTFE